MSRKFAQTLVVTSLFTAFLLAADSSFAAVRCETIYGGGETCVKTGELQITKEVWNAQSAAYVDNLDITSYKYTIGESIVFRLRIKNVGDETFDKVHVVDHLPGYLELTDGSLDFYIDDLNVDETIERTITAKVISLPDDKTTICVVNSAEVQSGDERDSDTSSVCLEKKVLGVSVQPATGPEDWLLFLSVPLLAGIAGLSLKKFTKSI